MTRTWCAGAAATCAMIAAASADEGVARDLCASASASTPPPELNRPTVIRNRCDIDRTFRDNEDVLILMPTDQTCSRAVSIKGGRVIRLVGGDFRYAGADADAGGRNAVITIGQSSAEIFIEGVHVRANGRRIDAIGAWRSVDARITVSNSLLEGVSYKKDKAHGDLIHMWDRVASLTLENVTGVTASQGFFLPRREPNEDNGHGPDEVTLKRVNLRHDTSRAIAEPDTFAKGWGIWKLYLANDGAGPQARPTRLEDVYIDDTTTGDETLDRLWHETVKPEDGDAGARLDEAAGRITFDPAVAMIEGDIRGGVPKGGDFVRPEEVGRRYVSPFPVPGRDRARGGACSGGEEG